MVSVGEILEGTITGVMPFGAFVDLGENCTGLVHISEVARNYVSDINDHISKGDVVKVKVLKVDEKGKISLSIKQALPEQKRERRDRTEHEKQKESAKPDDYDWNQRRDTGLSFEDQLSRFKQISDENMQAIRRSNESKRSGGYSRRGSR